MSKQTQSEKLLAEYNMDTLVNYMDDEIREEVHAELAPCTDIEFVERYCELHNEKYGEEFDIN